MTLEEFSRQMPKPVLAALVLLVAIFIIIFVIQPPHSICDTQAENLKENQKGILFPIKSGKRTYPGKVQGAMEACRLGNSPGSCYEYFTILRRAALAVKALSKECSSAALDIGIENYHRNMRCTPTEASRRLTKEDGRPYTEDELCNEARFPENVASIDYSSGNLNAVLEDGIKIMVIKAWGEKPPDQGPLRFGWLQDFDISVFCHLKDALFRARGEDGLGSLRSRIFQSLPGESPASSAALPGATSFPVPRVSTYMPEAQIFQRSLFSAPCENYR